MIAREEKWREEEQKENQTWSRVRYIKKVHFGNEREVIFLLPLIFRTDRKRKFEREILHVSRLTRTAAREKLKERGSSIAEEDTRVRRYYTHSSLSRYHTHFFLSPYRIFFISKCKSLAHRSSHDWPLSTNFSHSRSFDHLTSCLIFLVAWSCDEHLIE